MKHAFLTTLALCALAMFATACGDSDNADNNNGNNQTKDDQTKDTPEENSYCNPYSFTQFCSKDNIAVSCLYDPTSDAGVIRLERCGAAESCAETRDEYGTAASCSAKSCAKEQIGDAIATCAYDTLYTYKCEAGDDNAYRYSLQSSDECEAGCNDENTACRQALRKAGEPCIESDIENDICDGDMHLTCQKEYGLQDVKYIYRGNNCAEQGKICVPRLGCKEEKSFETQYDACNSVINNDKCVDNVITYCTGDYNSYGNYVEYVSGDACDEGEKCIMDDGDPMCLIPCSADELGKTYTKCNCDDYNYTCDTRVYKCVAIGGGYYYDYDDSFACNDYYDEKGLAIHGCTEDGTMCQYDYEKSQDEAKLPQTGAPCDDSFKFVYAETSRWWRAHYYYCKDGTIHSYWCRSDEDCFVSKDGTYAVCYDDYDKSREACNNVGEIKQECDDFLSATYIKTCTEMINGEKYYVVTKREDCQLGCNENNACVSHTDDGITCNDAAQKYCSNSKCALIDGKVNCYYKSDTCDEVKTWNECDGQSSKTYRCVLADDGQTIVKIKSSDYCQTACNASTGLCFAFSDDGKTCNETSLAWCKEQAVGQNQNADDVSCAIMMGGIMCYGSDDVCSQAGSKKYACENATDSYGYTCALADDETTLLWIHNVTDSYFCFSACNEITGRCE